MKKLFTFILFCTLSILACEAAVITLKSGKIINGEVLINNADVVIIRDNTGARFQYPASEVASIVDGDVTVEEIVEEQVEKKPQGKKVTFLLGLGGGGAFIPQETNGGMINGELLIGSRYIGKKTISLGGGVAVNSMFSGGQTYVFLPLQLAIKVPFIEGKHSPYVGAGLGYGFGIKNCSGGIYTGAEIGYRYVANPRTSLYVSVRADFQQATITGKTTVEGTTYDDHTGRNFITLGAHFGVSF